MKEFVLAAAAFAISSVSLFVCFVNDYNVRELLRKKSKQAKPETENYPNKLNHYRKPLMVQPSLNPVFEQVGYFKLTKHFGLIHEQLGEGGGERGIVCNATIHTCSSDCARKHIYTAPDGKKLFFCRCFYTVMLGTKLIDETTDGEAGASTSAVPGSAPAQAVEL